MENTSFFNDIPSLKPEDLVDLIQPSTVRISSSGTHLIYAAAPHGRKGEHAKTALHLGEVGKKHSARQFTSGSFNDHSPSWAPHDSNCFAFLSDRGEVGKASAIYLAHINGGEPYAITPAEHKRNISMFAWSPNGRFITFLSADEQTAERQKKEKDKDDVEVYGEELQYNRLRILNVSTREVRVVHADNEQVQSLCWSPCGKKLAVVTSQMPDDDSGCRDGFDFKIVDVVLGKVLSSFHLPGAVRSVPCWIENHIYFVAGVTPSAIATSSAVYKSQVSEVMSTKSYELHAHGSSDCAYGLKQCGPSHLVAYVQAGLRDELEDVLEGKTLWSAEQCIEGFGTTFDAYFPEDDTLGRAIVAFVTSDTSFPSEVFTRSGVSGDPIQISNHGVTISKHSFGGSYTPIRCRSFDNAVILEGYYVTPRDQPKKPLPTFVSIHGGPYMRLTRGFDGSSWSQTPYLLHTTQCGTLITNYRGNSSRGEDFAKYARGQVGTVEYDDILRLVQEGIDLGLIDPNHIIVGGWSQGGFLSYLSAVRNGADKLPNGSPKSWRFKGAICGAGVTDWDMMTMTSDMTTFEAECAGAAPWTADKSSVVARKGSPIWEFKAAAEAGAIPPILILHGKEDVRVPVSQAWAFLKACRRYGVPCEMAVYPREPHGVKERAHQIDMLKRCKRFCDLHFG